MSLETTTKDLNGLHLKETQFVGSIDCGTTSCRFYIFDQFANVICHHQIEFDQIYPEPGYHEHDPTSYLTTIDACILKCLEKFKVLGYETNMILTVGITNQRETTVVWNRETGEPLYNAIAWPDTRNTKTVRDLKEKAKGVEFKTPNGMIEGEEGVRALTGLPFSTYFTGVKYAWLLENVPAIKEAKESGTLMIGTVDSWLLYNYTGASRGGLHLTDLTNASRTLLLSLHTLQWCPELLAFFDIPLAALPKLVSNSEVYGKFREGPLKGIPIAALIGDQQSALVGNLCLEKGSAKQTYGTGCFMLYNTGESIVASKHGLLTTVGYQAGPSAPVNFALEGSVAVGGSSIQWLRDNLGIIREAKEAGELAKEVKDTGGVYFVTGFSGLFAPYWDQAATGLLIGLSGYTTKHHIARATLEATCFQTRAILEAMSKDTLPELDHGGGEEIDLRDARGLKVLKVDGGMTNCDVTMQLQADILGIGVERPTMRESTALGAALLAGSASKLFEWDLNVPDTLKLVNKAGVQVFNPSIEEEEKEWKYAGWNRAVNRSRGWKTNSGNG